MSVPKLLLLAGEPPSSTNVGGLWLQDICDLYPSEALCLVSRSKDERVSWQEPVATAYTYASYKFPITTSRWFVRPFLKSWDRIFTRPKLVKQILELGSRHQTELVLAVLHDDTIIENAVLIAKTLNVPLVSLIWDPAEWLHRRNPKTIRNFYKVINHSLSCIVMSEAMSDHYRKTSSASMVVMQRSIPREYWKSASKELKAKDAPFVIGFSGSIYTSKEFESLVQGLDSIGWEIGDRKVQVHILSRAQETLPFTSPNIHYLGWQPTVEAINELSRADVLYLPYAFGEHFQAAAMYSFPTKLSTYMSASVPVLYHGPYESVVRRFIETYPMGLGCYSNEPSEIISVLERLLVDAEIRQKAVETMWERREKMIAPEVFRKKFAEALQLDEADLN